MNYWKVIYRAENGTTGELRRLYPEPDAKEVAYQLNREYSHIKHEAVPVVSDGVGDSAGVALSQVLSP